jgi:hypothetical protein
MNILIADNDINDVILLKQGLEKIYPTAEIKISNNGSDCIQYLKQTVPNIIFLDLNLPAYNTFMLIADPNDMDGCRPLDSKSVSSSWSWIGQAETGLRIRLKTCNKNDHAFLQAGMGYTGGSRATFYTLLKPGQHDHSQDNYTVKFITPGGETHEHAIGKKNRVHTQQLFFSIGINYPFN